MCLGEYIYPELSVINKYYIYNWNLFYNQRIIFLIFEVITFLGPGSVWFYYVISSSECNSPIDEDIPTLIICYFITGLLLLIPTLALCLNKYYCFIFVKIILILYLIGKLTILIIMLSNVQSDFYKDWNDCCCDNLKTITTFWLVWNYIIMILSFIYTIVHIASSTCDYYDENDYDPI